MHPRHLRRRNDLLTDVFGLYLKTKNFHWHMSGANFRDYHVVLDDHGDELFAITDPLAERPEARRLYTALDQRHLSPAADQR